MPITVERAIEILESDFYDKYNDSSDQHFEELIGRVDSDGELGIYKQAIKTEKTPKFAGIYYSGKISDQETINDSLSFIRDKNSSFGVSGLFDNLLASYIKILILPVTGTGTTGTTETTETTPKPKPKYKIKPPNIKKFIKTRFKKGFEVLKRKIDSLCDEFGILKINQYDIGKRDDNPRRIVIKNNDESIKIERILTQTGDDLILYHYLLFLPEDLQGRGIAKKFNELMYEECKEMGVTKIEVNAVSVGGYAWAHAFYVDKSEVYRVLRDNRDDTDLLFAKERILKNARDPEIKADNPELNREITIEEVNQIISKIKEIMEEFDKTGKTRFPMKLLADMNKNAGWGKLLLLNSNWHGSVNLRKAEERKVYEKYLGIKKRSKQGVK